MPAAPDAAIPDNLRGAVNAVHAAAADAQRRREEAELVEREILGLAYLAMRRHGFSDHYAASQLGHRPTELKSYAKAIRWFTLEHNVSRSQIEQLWRTARLAASTWFESETITSSRDVIFNNNIDDIDYPLPVSTLDTDGAEFVHQRTGEKLLVYCPQRWNGTPTQSDGQHVRWDHKGRYRIEFISAAGERGTLAPATLGLTEADTQFDTSTPKRRGDHATTFARIITAIRRTHAILPPYNLTAIEGLNLR
ncbi:hypothetical protein [Candidatus Mycobacterium methanotrophicum]|uniref:Uncharacterized protein n=1 Tax=Candidatus Mycobacterium methanotrophicum TaxID=2943498 RepID=A0ABY4QT31_9MYCO|nr:hypothetical protein [Candidatus Mycobacterium methanotrophicum]UQX13523.1 hypothetical protein M5I08_25350 [Candidatus Mycobacterium methanotrophicum]